MLDEDYQVEFAGNRLDLVPGVELYNYDFSRLPNRDSKVYKLARRDLSILTSSEYTSKEIPIWLDVCSGTRQDTEETLSDLKGLVQKQNGLLRVLHANDVVEYTATLNEFNTEWNGPNAYCQLVFIATTPLGQSTTTKTLFAMNSITASTSSASFVVDGSFDAEPLITANILAVTGGTSGSLNIFNAATNQGIVISKNFVAGDLVEIDSANYSVTVNGLSQDFTGIFPSWPAGSMSVGYSDTFTTRQVDVTATYKPRFS